MTRAFRNSFELLPDDMITPPYHICETCAHETTSHRGTDGCMHPDCLCRATVTMIVMEHLERNDIARRVAAALDGRVGQL